MPDVKGNPIDLSQVVPFSIVPTEKLHWKKDRQGNVQNKFPGMFLVRCSYNGNNNYHFYATQAEVDSLQPVTRKQYNEVCAEVNSLRLAVEELTAKKGK